ncbi:hypothetical protein [Pedobacter sp. Hv1]|uniref:hypothetical protein n=1 Tax=Pedobacter sp. Hv1 TaxID=1740090 RepID=UPI0006D8CDCD|nr:hypothetical protein [Pedobacter sp. Hv1]KQB99154.1 hypothetical protein AQF98_16355 [Pedobacter sp. Hv1]
MRKKQPVKKLTFFKKEFIASALLFLCLFLVQCKKDIVNPTNDQFDVNKQVIKEEQIINLLNEIPAAQLLTLDWKKSQQATVDGKKIVRIPILNINKLMNVELPPDLRLNENISQGKQMSGKTQSNGSSNEAGTPNPNYFEKHPPELFIIKDAGSDKLSAYLFNFVPTNPNVDFGENGIWTGNLYEWNLKGETVWTQEIVKSKLKQKYGLKNPNQTESTNKVGAKGKVLRADDQKVGYIFKWLADLLGDVVGWIAHTLGIPTYYTNHFGGGWRIDWGAFPTSNPDSDGGFTGPVDRDGVYGSYVPGYGSGGNYDPYPNNNPSGPTSGSATVAGSTLYLIRTLELTDTDEMDFLAEHPTSSDKLATYLEAMGKTTESKAFVKWAIERFMNDNNVSLEQLDNIYDAIRHQNYVPKDREPASYYWRSKLSTDDFSSFLTEITPLWINRNGTEIKNVDAFNCHYHAFGLQYATETLEGYPKWVTAIKLESKDWSTVTGNIQVGDRVMYSLNNNGASGWTHSAIVTEVDADGYATKVSSKMGTYEIIEHHPRDIPAAYGTTGPTFTLDGKTVPSRIYWRKK